MTWSIKNRISWKNAWRVSTSDITINLICSAIGNLSLYFDTAQHLVISYGDCRLKCEDEGHFLIESKR